MKNCADQFTIKEQEWWENFVDVEEKKHTLWQNMTEDELRCGGDVARYLKNSKEYMEPENAVEVVDMEDVQRKKRTIKKLYAKENAFKPVLLFPAATGLGQKQRTFQRIIKIIRHIFS